MTKENSNDSAIRTKVQSLIDGGSFKFAAGCAVVLATLLLVVELDLFPLWGSEGRWAAISQHMFRSGELFNPLIGTFAYWDKPLLSYWCVLPFAYLLGSVTETAVRLPSAMSGLLMLFLTYDLGRRWFNGRTGFFSMAILATSIGFVFWGRNGQVEMLNAAAILWSIWYFLRHKSDEGVSWFYILGVGTAIGANMKGLPAYGVPGFCIFLASVVRKDWKWLPRWHHVILAGLLSLAIWLAFPFAAWVFSGNWKALEFVWRENVVRFFAPFDHKDPAWIYLVRIYDLAGPWALFLPAAFIQYVMRVRERTSPIAELFFYFAGVFLMFTLSGSRRPYYLLPILPFASILVAYLLAEYTNSALSKRMAMLVRCIAGLIMILTVAPLAALFVQPKAVPGAADSMTILVILAASLGVAGAAMFACCLRKNLGGMVASILAAWLVGMYGIAPICIRHDDYRDDIARITASGQPVAYLRADSARVVYYLDTKHLIIPKEPEAYEWARAQNGIVITQDKLPRDRWAKMIKGRAWSAVTPIAQPTNVQVSPIPALDAASPNLDTSTDNDQTED